MSIPALRFKEFNEKWSIKRLSDVADKIGDGLHSTPVYDENGQYYFVNGNNLTNNKIEISENTKRVNFDEYLKYKIDLTTQSVLISINGTIGNLAFYNDEKVILGKSACYINLKENENKYFVFNLFQTSNITSHFEKELTGSTIKNLSLTTIKNTKAFFPSYLEQTKIANFLTTVDEKITQLTQKHDLLTQYKKGVMQQLFSQELRFKDDDGQDFPEWEEINLNEIAQIIGGGTPDTTVAEYWQGNVQWFTPTEIKTKYATNSLRTITETGLKNSSAKVLPIGTLLFSSRATVGDVSIALNECTTNQGFQSMIVNDKNNNEFIYYWILNNKKAFLEKASGSTFLEISKKEIEKLPVQHPCIKEQTKIANFLTVIDDKITATQTQLQAVKRYKQGLLQQMFV